MLLKLKDYNSISVLVPSEQINCFYDKYDNTRTTLYKDPDDSGIRYRAQHSANIVAQAIAAAKAYTAQEGGIFNLPALDGQNVATPYVWVLDLTQAEIKLDKLPVTVAPDRLTVGTIKIAVNQNGTLSL